MAGGEVLDVDVVALAGAVGRGVVVAEDAQPVATTHGDLRDERHEVVGDPLRVLADRAGRVGADGVEVAQDRDPPRGVDVRDVAQHHLDHHLGPPVRAGGLERLVVLAIGHGSLVAVHGRGRGEHQRRAAVPAHGSQQRERRLEVVLVVVQWQLHTFTDGLQPREVDDRVDLLRGEEMFRLVAVGEVESVYRDVSVGECVQSRHDRGFGVPEIVHDENVVTRRRKMDDGVRTDVPGPTTDQYSHAHTVCRGSSRTTERSTQDRR